MIYDPTFMQYLSNFSKRRGGRLVPSGRLRHVPLPSIHFLCFSLMILTFAICSSVIGLHPDLKRACPSEKIRSHVFMNRGIGPKHFTKFLMIFTLSTEWVTRGFGLNVRRIGRGLLCPAASFFSGVYAWLVKVLSQF